MIRSDHGTAQDAIDFALDENLDTWERLDFLRDWRDGALDERGHLRTLEEIERDLIQHAIEVYAGHMSEIARRLGIGRSTLYRKVREQGLEGILKEVG